MGDTHGHGLWAASCSNLGSPFFCQDPALGGTGQGCSPLLTVAPPSAPETAGRSGPDRLPTLQVSLSFFYSGGLNRDLAILACKRTVTSPLRSPLIPGSRQSPPLPAPSQPRRLRAGSAQPVHNPGPVAALPACVLDKSSSCHFLGESWPTHCHVFSAQG